MPRPQRGEALARPCLRLAGAALPMVLRHSGFRLMRLHPSWALGEGGGATPADCASSGKSPWSRPTTGWGGCHPPAGQLGRYFVRGSPCWPSSGLRGSTPPLHSRPPQSYQRALLRPSCASCVTTASILRTTCPWCQTRGRDLPSASLRPLTTIAISYTFFIGLFISFPAGPPPETSVSYDTGSSSPMEVT